MELFVALMVVWPVALRSANVLELGSPPTMGVAGAQPGSDVAGDSDVNLPNLPYLDGATHSERTAECEYLNQTQISDPDSKNTKGPWTAETPDDCCTICAQNSECTGGAVLYGMSCFIKTDPNLPRVHQESPDVQLVACIPKKEPPSPPSPPPGPTPPKKPSTSGGSALSEGSVALLVVSLAATVSLMLGKPLRTLMSQ